MTTQVQAQSADTQSVIVRLPARLRLDSQAGFGIIEVLVSAILVVVVGTGVFVAFDTATRASGANKARSVATNVARGDQEKLRGTTADDLATLLPTRTEDVDGRTYTVASSTEWVADRTGTASCTSADGRADYLKLRSSVTWGGIGTAPPVVMESLRAIPRGEFRPNQGTIAVKVTDRTGGAVPGVSVTITGTRGYSGVTNSLGCLLIDQVPVGPYSASIALATYVTDVNPNDAVVVKDFVVAKEQTSSVPVTMDRAGTARVAFRTNQSAPNGTTYTGATGEGFTVLQIGLGDPTTRSFSLASATAAQGTLYSGTGTAALTTNATRGMFPFSSAYTMWAGTCDQANPANQVPPAVPPTVQTQTISPGALATSVNLHEPRLQISLRLATGNLNRSRIVVKPEVSSCARPAVVENTSTTTPTHTAVFSLPYGDYTVCAQEGQGSPTGTGAGSGANNQTNRRTAAPVAVQNRATGGSAPATITLPTATTSGKCPY